MDKRLTDDEIREIKTALLVDEPRVHAYEVADELGFDASAFSRLFRRNSTRRLPHGTGCRTVLDAIERIRAKRVAA